jgi:glutamine phosphoribosylpyrophosphate amidotransferase
VIAICGLAGFALSHTERCDARALASALLLGIVERGRHATGAAWHDGPRVAVQKEAVPATSFVHRLAMPAGARTAVLHTRWETQGSSRNIDNVHPIRQGPLYGTHNGCLANDDELFDEIGPDKRIAQVDSEAIFAALVHLPGSTGDVLGRLRGSVAVAWLDDRDRVETLHAARVSSSPFVYASTERALLAAMRNAGMDLAGAPAHLPEGVALRVQHGRVVGKDRFETARGRALTSTERQAIGA